MKHFWLHKRKRCSCGCNKRVWIYGVPYCFENLKSILVEQNVFIEQGRI